MYAGFVMTLKSSKAGYELILASGPIGVVLWFPSYVKYTYLCIGKVPLPWHRASPLLTSYSIEYACASCLVPRNVELWSGTFYND